MKRCGHGQHDGPLGTFCLRRVGGTLDGSRMAGDHGLFRRIEIDGLDDQTLGAFVARCLNCNGIKSEDGRHRPDPGRHGLLHGLGAEFNQRHSVFEAEHVCCNQR